MLSAWNSELRKGDGSVEIWDMHPHRRDHSMPTHLQRTRKFVEQTFQQLDQHTTLPLREAALIRDGQYCGHRFTSRELSAVWFFEEDEVKIYGDNHQLIHVESTSAEAQRRAA